MALYPAPVHLLAELNECWRYIRVFVRIGLIDALWLRTAAGELISEQQAYLDIHDHPAAAAADSAAAQAAYLDAAAAVQTYDASELENGERPLWVGPIALALPQVQQNDRGAASSDMQRIAEMRGENERCKTIFSRSCGICLELNPRVRACLTMCGHTLCLACAEELANTKLILRCPYCRMVGPFVKMFEEEVETSPNDFLPRPLGGGGGGGGGEEEWSSPSKILMRGLPSNVTSMDIEIFFAPLRCYEIKLGMNEERLPSGDGSVEFRTIPEAREALQRDTLPLASRYIELYPGHDVPPSIRRIRFRRVGGAPAILPAPLSIPSYRSMPASPIPTGRPPVSSPRFEPPMMYHGGGGAPPRGSPTARDPSREGASARNVGAYCSPPSRDSNGGPPEYRANQEAYGPSSWDSFPHSSYGMDDEGYGRGGGVRYGGHGDVPLQNQRTADSYGGPPQRTADPYGASPQGGANPYGWPLRRPAPAHNGGGDYSGYEGYGGGGGQYGAGNAGAYY